MKIVRRGAFEHRQLSSAKTGEKYSLSAVLSGVLESRDFFLHHEILPAGARASAPHFHRETEEIVYVLRGNVVALEGEEKFALSAGDCACFAAGSNELHFLANESAAEAELLVVSKKLPGPDVCFEA